ncbi:hypothetical protein OROMI_009339 [Orobanche minor]
MGKQSRMNQPDDKGCIYGLGSLVVALSAPAISSSQETVLVALIFLQKLTWGNDDRDWGHHDYICGNLLLSVIGAYYKSCQSEVYGEREQLNPPDDKGCIYGLGSLGVALSAPAISSSQKGNDDRDWGHHDNIWGNLWLSVLGACYKGCQSEVYGEREQIILNPPDDKGCIYGLGSLGVALSAPATSSSQATARVALIFLQKLTRGKNYRDWGHHDNIWGNLWVS